MCCALGTLSRFLKNVFVSALICSHYLVLYVSCFLHFLTHTHCDTYPRNKRSLLMTVLALCTGATFGCTYCYHSRWPKHSHSENERTMCTLTSEANEHCAARAAGVPLKPGAHGSSAGLLKHFHFRARSIRTETRRAYFGLAMTESGFPDILCTRVCCKGKPPMKFLQGYDEVLSVMSYPQLHVLLGVVPVFTDEIERIAPDIAAKWLRKCGVVNDMSKGGHGFVGPQVRWYCFLILFL